eukprot:5407797-Lingulodinium_polyedra.AAC.1
MPGLPADANSTWRKRVDGRVAELEALVFRQKPASARLQPFEAKFEAAVKAVEDAEARVRAALG